MERKTAAAFVLAAFGAMLAFGCKTVPASLPKEKAVDVPELGGQVKIGEIQYGYRAFEIEDKKYYDPAKKDQNILILTIKPKNIARRIEYDFHDIALTNGTVTKYPALLRYYYDFNEWEKDRGYAVSKDGELKLKFNKSGEHRIILGFVYSEGDVFDKLVFYGNTEVEFDTVLGKAAPVFN